MERRYYALKCINSNILYFINLQAKESEVFSEKDDQETIDLFEKNLYKFNEDQKSLSYGKMKVQLK